MKLVFSMDPRVKSAEYLFPEIKVGVLIGKKRAGIHRRFAALSFQFSSFKGQ